MTKNTFYITTAIDYPNAKPHIGHAFEKIISDVIYRWHKKKGEKVFFSTGTDEHGQKLEKYAKDEQKDPKDFVDEKVIFFIDLCNKLSIDYDNFIRTTDPEHEKLSQTLFDKALQKGDIYLGKYKGNYCIYDETFFTDKDLVEGKCPVCNRETQLVEEESYFFRMSKYQEKIIDYIEENDYIRPQTRQNEILYRLKNEELRDLCVSRTTFSWGVPLLNNPKHVIYVWFDALINYLSSIGYPDKENAILWPADVHVIGKDIIWFHTVIWPAMLLCLEIPLPKKVYAHGFILSKEGDKMSKSKGNSMDPLELVNKYSSDALRYYLCKVIPYGDDGYFSEKELVEKYNNELGNDLGNLVMRCVKLSCKKIGEEVSAPEGYTNDLIDICNTTFSEADAYINRFEYDRALITIWKYIKKINQYLTEKEPWKEEDSSKVHHILYTALDNLSNATAMISSYIPDSSKKIEQQLGISVDFKNFDVSKRFILKDEDALFPKIEFEEKEVFPLNLKVAEIIDVKEHPDAEKLLILNIDLGYEKRQLVAGLRKYYTKDDLIGKKIAVLTNLKPAKLRGVESNGMLLAGVDDDQAKVIEFKESKKGDQIYPGKEKEFEIETKQIKIDDFAKIDLLIKDKKISFEHKILRTNSEEASVGLEKGKIF